MRKRDPFGMIDRFLLTVGFDAECETLTFLGVQPHTLQDLGLVAVDDDSGEVLDDADARLVPREEAPRPIQVDAPAVEAVQPEAGVAQPAVAVEPGDEIQAGSLSL